MYACTRTGLFRYSRRQRICSSYATSMSKYTMNFGPVYTSGRDIGYKAKEKLLA